MITKLVSKEEPCMYEYNYADVNLEIIGGWSKSDSNYHEIIDEYAKKGWRFVQLIPVSYNYDGKPVKFEIIFEREIKKNNTQNI